MKFKRVILSPQPYQTTKWKAIPSSLWKLFQRSKTEGSQNLPPLITYLENEHEEPLSKPIIQLSIVFCSRMTSHLFVGFLPENAPLIGVIR